MSWLLSQARTKLLSLAAEYVFLDALERVALDAVEDEIIDLWLHIHQVLPQDREQVDTLHNMAL